MTIAFLLSDKSERIVDKNILSFLLNNRINDPQSTFMQTEVTIIIINKFILLLEITP